MIDQYDNVEGYCKMLGHFLTFKYCRSVNKGLPCGKAMDCWFEYFNVQDFITNHYTPEQLKRCAETPRTKINSIADILEQAQKRLHENKKS